MTLILHKGMTWKEVHKSDGMQWGGFLRLLEVSGSLCAAGGPCQFVVNFN